MPKALLVDDNPANLYLLQVLLAGSGYQTVSASNGAEALEAAHRDRFDVAISDILMPVMDGFALCRAWKGDEALRDIPFIFYTATYTDPKDEQFALSLGADAFLVKPMDPGDFIEAMAGVVQRQGHPGAAVKNHRPTPEETFLREYNATLIRKLEDKLIELSRRNEQLAVKEFAISSASSGIALADPGWTLTYVNRALCDLLGHPESALLGTDARRLIEDRSAIREVATALESHGRWLGEIQVRRRGGNPLTVQAAVHVVRNDRDDPVSLMVSCLDMTQRREMEDRLRRAQRLETMGIFAAGIVHDFNNILGSLCCTIELAQMQVPNGSPQVKLLEAAASSCAVARDLLRKLAAFARGESVPRTRVDVADLLRRCARLSLTASGVRFEAAAGEGPWVEGEESQLLQLFSNLLINARQAMPAGGTIRASTSLKTMNRNEVDQLPEGPYVVVEIADEGVGIPPAILERVFDPFFSTKLEGTGLGLAICFSVARSHGGHISLDSRPGAGTRVTVFLPACPSAAG